MRVQHVNGNDIGMVCFFFSHEHVSKCLLKDRAILMNTVILLDIRSQKANEETVWWFLSLAGEHL